MLILGIDPGTTRIGYGLVKKTRRTLKLIDFGVFTTIAKDTPGRLCSLAKNIKKLLRDSPPDVVAIERIFFFKNKKTAFEIAQAIGVLIFISAQHKLSPIHYTPLEIKQTITGYGFAEKEEVTKIVTKTLRIKNFKGFDDATDALAVALTAGCKLYQKKNLKDKKAEKTKKIKDKKH